MQEEVNKGGSLPHILHERLDIDNSSDLRAISISRQQQGEQQYNQQQMQNRDKRQVKNKEK